MKQNIKKTTFSNNRLKRASKFLNISEPLLDFSFLALISYYLYSLLPPEILHSGPASGGDTGSHFWPLYALVKHGLPNASIKLWNPGNLAGEPLFVHYFPLPFLFMAFLSFFMPLGVAFNFGTILCLFLLPLGVYFAVRLMGYRFPAPIFAAALTLPFMYNESFSMWGGNTLSTLAGQFAHVYALFFAVLGLGFLFRETIKEKFPMASGLLFACVALSHAYVLLGIPFLCIGYLLFYQKKTFKFRFIKLVKSGLIAVSFSLWFLVPMLDNSKWNTAFFFVWHSKNLLKEVLPGVFYLAVAVLIISVVFFLYEVSFRARKSDYSLTKNLLSLFAIWLIPIAAYGYMYKIFPDLGLVDVRVFPQIQLFASILAGIALGITCRSYSRLGAWLITGPFLLTSFYWGTQEIKVKTPHFEVDAVGVKNFPGWAKYNYSGWKVKSGYKDLSKLYAELKGDFSDPRVIYEHNDINEKGGTLRVFEMLPYFAKRATLESVYLQASIASPAAFHMQALVSKTPSCPFSQYPCKGHVKTKEDVQILTEKMSLMGVQELILHTKDVRDPIAESYLFDPEKSFNHWHLRKMAKPVSLVEVFKVKPIIYENEDWKKAFYNWFETYRESKPLLVSAEQMSEATRNNFSKSLDIWKGGDECQPKVDVGFSKITLTTNCPNKAHLLKFSYHPSWKGDFEGEILNVSPGFMALVPGKEKIQLKFAKSNLWLLSNVLSWIGMFVSIYFWRRFYR